MMYRFLALSLLLASALSGPTYGQTVATPVGASGSPQVAAYQTTTGTWRKPLPVSLICAGGYPCNYLQASGGNTSGALNGVTTFQGLVGSSASGASTVLTTDGSGTVNGANCLQVPAQGVTKAVINVIGASTNGTDAVMQVYPGIALFTASAGTPSIQGTTASFYPVFGSPNPWSVVPTVDASTKCVVITTKGSGSGSWKWRASIQYENLVP